MSVVPDFGKRLPGLILSGAVFLSAPALAQPIRGGFLASVPGEVSPNNPSVTIRVSAWWNPHPQYHWFSHGGFDFASAGGGEFSNPTVLPVYSARIVPPWSRPGSLEGGLVRGVWLDQTFLTHLSLFPLLDNPLPLWAVTWTTDDFTPRRVRIGTTGREGIYIPPIGLPPYPGMEYVPGAAFIRVVPAPAWGPLMACGALFVTHRRRPTR